jgi:hypothetical protein
VYGTTKKLLPVPAKQPAAARVFQKLGKKRAFAMKKAIPPFGSNTPWHA